MSKLKFTFNLVNGQHWRDITEEFDIHKFDINNEESSIKHFVLDRGARPKNVDVATGAIHAQIVSS